MWRRSIHKVPAAVRNFLQSAIFILPIAGLWASGKRLHGRTWEIVCRSLCVGTHVLEGVGYNGESEHSWGLAQSDKVLHLTFQQGMAIQWWMMPLMETSKLWLALAGSFKLQGSVPAHLITCSPASSLLTPYSQHLVGKGHILKNVLWQQKQLEEKFWNLKNAT